MSTLTDRIKRYGMIAASITAIAGMLWGVVEAGVSIDERYLHKESAHEVLDNRYMKVADYRDEKLKERIKFLEDQIFMLNFKLGSGEATPLEQAMLERYKSELEALRARIRI